MECNYFCHSLTQRHAPRSENDHARPVFVTLRLKRDGTREETRFRLSPERTSPFQSTGASVQSTAGSRGVRISFSNDGYTTFRSSMRILATHSIRQFPLNFPFRASPCAIRFQTHSTRRFFLVKLPVHFSHCGKSCRFFLPPD